MAEEAARAAVKEPWETRFELAKDELKEEMRNIVSSTASGADQRISVEDSTEISQLSLHEGCQLNAIWKCLVVLYHIMFKIKGVSLHFREELAPWRRAHNVAESGIKLSVQGTQTMEKFDKETRHVMPIGNTSVFIQIQSGKIF